jgi:CheY-like chemotaxis protein
MGMSLKCILVVGFKIEEEQIIQRQWFKSGLRVPLRFASDAEIALELIPKSRHFYERPDLVIVKLKEDQDNGWEFLTSMRQQPKHREVLVIVCAENFSAEAAERAYALGADSCVDMSSDFWQLFRLLHRVERHWFEPPDRMVA